MKIAMQYSLFPILLIAQIGAVTASCAADNCYRAVVGSAFPTRHGSADCSSFFETTVTPAVTTVTVTGSATAEATVTYPSYPGRKRRDAAPAIAARQQTVIPSAIPAYASPCSGAVRYSSACSCIGVTAATTTVTAPQTTVTVSNTAIAGTVTECANALPTFILQIENSGVSIHGKPIDGTYGNFDDDDGPIIGFNGEPESDAVVLSLNSLGYLTLSSPGDDGTAGYVGYYNGEPGYPALIHFVPENQVLSYGNPVVCTVTAQGTLSCTANGCYTETGCQNGIGTLQICPNAAITNDLWIGGVIGFECLSPTFNVIDVCQEPPLGISHKL